MPATKNNLIKWFQIGVKNNQSYMIIECDTYNFDDFPIYTNSLEEFEEEYKKVSSRRNQIMEVYDLKIDMNLQMNEDRSFHYPEGFKVQDLYYPEISKVYKQGVQNENRTTKVRV